MQVQNNIFKTYKAFFDLPFEEKNKVNMDLTSSNRGWGAPKGEQVNPDYNPDYKEIFDTGPHQKVKDEFRDLTYYAKNLWPEQLPLFENTVNNYYNLCTQIGMHVLSFIERSLDLSENFFRISSLLSVDKLSQKINSQRIKFGDRGCYSRSID